MKGIECTSCHGLCDPGEIIGGVCLECLENERQRQIRADEDGLWVPLTKEHHTAGKIGAHQCKEVRVLLQMLAQVSYERDRCAEGMSKVDARKRYGKSYL